MKPSQLLKRAAFTVAATAAAASLVCMLLVSLGQDRDIVIATNDGPGTRVAMDLSKDQIEKINASLSDFSARSNQRAGRLTPDEIVKMSAVKLARAIKDKRLTSEEATAAFLRRDLEINPKYNAIVTYNVHAMDQARQADLALAGGISWGPLHGVPFTVKDTFATKGLRTTAGSVRLKDYVPEQNAAVVERLLNAGGILLGKTNTPVLAGDVQTSNPLFGTTNNAIDPRYVAGGSSGGPAVAVALGLSPFDIGSDLGGSIRIPASFNGVYGFRPTFELVSNRGHIPPAPDEINGMRHMLVAGPLARSIDDLEFILPLIAGPGEGDHRTAPLPPASRPSLGVKDLRIVWTDHFGEITADESISSAMRTLAGKLQAAGATVVQAEPPGFPYEKAWETFGSIIGHQGDYERSNFVRWLGHLWTRSAFGTTPALRKSVGPISVRTYMQDLAVQDGCIEQLESFPDHYDAWLVPVTATPVFRHLEPTRHLGEFPIYDTPLQAGNKALPYWVAAISFVSVFSLTESPVVTLPIGQDQAGMPIGIQVVGRRFSDMELLEVAKVIDSLK
jgi:amidase